MWVRVFERNVFLISYNILLLWNISCNFINLIKYPNPRYQICQCMCVCLYYKPGILTVLYYLQSSTCWLIDRKRRLTNQTHKLYVSLIFTYYSIHSNLSRRNIYPPAFLYIYFRKYLSGTTNEYSQPRKSLISIASSFS